MSTTDRQRALIEVLRPYASVANFHGEDVMSAAAKVVPDYHPDEITRTFTLIYEELAGAGSIRSLIFAHRAAWDAFQVAPVGEASQVAENAMHSALKELLFTPVESHEDVAAMLCHLDWYISSDGEGEAAEKHALAYRAALYWGQSRGVALLLEAR